MAYSYLYTFIRTIIIYILLLFLTRIIERKLIAQMTFFDFVIAITLGTAGATAAIGPQEIVLQATIVTVTLALVSIIFGYMHIKSFKIRKLINSEPVIVIENGAIVNQNMKKIRLTVNELMMKLREKDMFNLADVEFAIMEIDGEISVMPKPGKQPLTPSHMNIIATSKGLTKDIIIDGVIMEENLKAASINKAWLINELNSQGIRDISEVFYAGIDNSKILYVSKRKDNKEREGRYGIG